MEEDGAGGYHDRTARIEREYGGRPPCPRCKQSMVAGDDHGRFACWNEECPTNAGNDFGQMLVGDGGVYPGFNPWDRT